MQVIMDHLLAVLARRDRSLRQRVARFVIHVLRIPTVPQVQNLVRIVQPENIRPLVLLYVQLPEVADVI
jgi:hypothetical protein